MYKSYNLSIIKFVSSSVKRLIFPCKQIADNNSYLCEVEFGDDIVHPCVRFIEGGFRGYYWWMVYTPYPNFNSYYENPILCFSKENHDGYPTKWYKYLDVKGPHEEGYNSDPSLLYFNDHLYITWRECFTPNTKTRQNSFETYCCCLDNNGSSPVYFSNPLLENIQHYSDSGLSPNFDIVDNIFCGYSIDFSLRSKSDFVNHVRSNYLGRLFFSVFTVFGVNFVRKFNGITFWSAENINCSFKKRKVIKPCNLKRYYELWHFDIFYNNDILYFVFLSNETGGDIIIGKLLDGKLILSDTPLIASNVIKNNTLYKPSAVLKEGELFLFYTLKLNGINKLFFNRIDFNKIK